MSKIHRSPNNVTGDVTITDGDIVLTDNTRGIVMPDNNDDKQRAKIVADGGIVMWEIDDA